MSSIRAVGDTVLLKEAKVEHSTSSGIILNRQSNSPVYEVVAIGDLAVKEHILDVGNKVVIKHTVGTNVPIDSTTIYKSVKWWEIDGIVEEDFK